MKQAFKCLCLLFTTVCNTFKYFKNSCFFWSIFQLHLKLCLWVEIVCWQFVSDMWEKPHSDGVCAPCCWQHARPCYTSHTKYLICSACFNMVTGCRNREKMELIWEIYVEGERERHLHVWQEHNLQCNTHRLSTLQGTDNPLTPLSDHSRICLCSE